MLPSQLRNILKSDFHKWGDILPDKEKNIPQPPLVKSGSEGAKIQLPTVSEDTILQNNLYDALTHRKTHRKFTDEALTISELSFLLYFTQGIKRITPNNKYTFRTVPSGGIRHPFETYLSIRHVDNLKSGIYHYLPDSHCLEFMFEDPDVVTHMKTGALGQTYVGNCAVTFMWCCIPYRTEWRYHQSSYKTILLDAGHVCQNLYIACEAIQCGTCAIGAYDQEYMDNYLRLDSEEEFLIYMAPVGKI